MEVQRWLPWRSGGEESACQSRSSGTQASPLSGEIAHAATAGACTAEPASVTTRSCGPQPERSPARRTREGLQAAVKAPLSQKQ